MMDKGTEKVGNKRTSGCHPKCNIVEIGQNTERIPGDLKRFVVTETPVRNYRLVWKKTWKISKCRLYGDRDETINHIISECSKLAQKEYKARNYWVGKVIHWEMCKKFQSDHTNKWYMHNPAPVLQNATHELLWEFNIHTDT